MRRLVLTLLLTATPAFTQVTPTHTSPQEVHEAQAASADPLSPLDFLKGTWSATTNDAGSSGGKVIGNYTFRNDLNGHELIRTGSLDQCKGPAAFDCQHHDQLIIFSDPNGRAVHGSSLFAFYADNEGHIIYYTVSTPNAHTAIFDSQNAPGTPKFRLYYHLEGTGPLAVMNGKFQAAAPGTSDYKSYLEWYGTKQ